MLRRWKGKRIRRWLAVVSALFALLCAWPAASATKVFLHVRVEGVINPIKARHVARAVERAESEGAAFLLVSIDTPGGLVSSMQEIVSSLSNAKVPVVAFVEPRSAQATSAGAFVLLAADIAVMAPGTRVGAAHPVGGDKPLEGVLDQKATNSLASLVKSLAARRGRPSQIAEAMVRESVSYTAEEAHDKKLIELLAADLSELLVKLEGREARPGRTLSMKGLVRVPIEISAVDQALDRFADPTLTSMLLSLGMLAIVYELSTPGIGAGGAVGAVLLVLGLLGSSVLPIEISALVLLAIGVAAIALEVKLPTHGVLGGAGIVAIVLGGALLVDPSGYFGAVESVNYLVFVPTVLSASIGLALLARVAQRALSRPPETGREALVGKRGVARSAFGRDTAEPQGQVFVDGARWQALTDEAEIRPGDAIEVVAISTQPMRLSVRRVS